MPSGFEHRRPAPKWRQGPVLRLPLMPSGFEHSDRRIDAERPVI